MLDPLAARELRGLARRVPGYLLRVLYLACAAAILHEGWGAEARDGLYHGPSAFAEPARRLFRDLFWLQFAFVPLAATLAGAELLVREKRQGTIDLLRLTPLGEAGIVRGAWRAAMGQAALLTLAGAPVLALCVYFGGAGPVDLAAAVGLTLAMAALSAAFAVRAAAVRRSVAGATASALAWIAGTAIFPLAAGFFSAGLAIVAALFLHPLYAAAGLRIPPYLQSLATAGWPASLVATAFWVSYLLDSASRELGRRVHEHVPAAAAPPFPFIHARTPEVWDARPLLWKEIATRGFRRLLPETRLFALGVFWATSYVALVGSQGRSLDGLRVFGVLALGAAALLGAFLFRDPPGDPLLAAPVSAHALLRAKLLGGLLAPEALALVPPLLAALLLFSFRAGPEGLLLFSLSALLLFALAYLLSAWASLFARSAAGAFAASSAAVCLLAAAFPAAWPAAADLVLPYRVFEALLPPPTDVAPPPDALPRARAAFGTSGPALIGGVSLVYFMTVRRFAGRAGRR